MFLPFGTIAPGLLLPLLAFVYMLFFGSYALNKTTGEDRPGNPEERIFIEPGESFLNSATPVFSYSTDDSTDACEGKTADLLNVDRHVCLVIKIPGEDIVPDTHLLPCFARPPPVSAKA
jgi:hypothetical protein